MMKTGKKILTFIILFLFCATVTACSATSLPDSIILQNKRYPKYAEYLQGNDYITYYVREGHYKKGKAYNLLHLQVYDSDTSKISRRVNYNGTITLDGKDRKKNTYIRITDNFTLQPGSYSIYDGHVSDGENITVFINGYDKDGNSKRIAELPENGTFEVTQNTYSYYRMYIAVAKSFNCDSRTIFPMLCYENTEVSQFYSPIFSIAPRNSAEVGDGSYEQCIIFNITKEDLSSIPYKDLKIFLRNLKYIYAQRYVSCTLAFEDGTGIQFQDCDPDKGIYGTLDGWYRANQLTGIVTDTGTYLTLYDKNDMPLSNNTLAYGINGIEK